MIICGIFELVRMDCFGNLYEKKTPEYFGKFIEDWLWYNIKILYIKIMEKKIKHKGL